MDNMADVPTETRIFWGVTNSDLSTVPLHQKLRTYSQTLWVKKVEKTPRKNYAWPYGSCRQGTLYLYTVKQTH